MFDLKTILTIYFIPILYSPVQSCSVLPGYEWVTWEMKDLFYSAPIAVIGKFVSLDEENNVGDFQLLCILKWDRYEAAPVSIQIEEAVFVNSCTERSSYRDRLGEVNMVALERGFNGIFNFYEPDIGNSAAYPATPENMRDVAKVCDMKIVDVVPHGEIFSCPVTPPWINSINCYETSSAQTVVVLGTTLMIIAGALLSSLLMF